MDVGAWLRGLGLEQYERAFRENDVDVDLLAKLTAEDLKPRTLKRSGSLRSGTVAACWRLSLPSGPMPRRPLLPLPKHLRRRSGPSGGS